MRASFSSFPIVRALPAYARFLRGDFGWMALCTLGCCLLGQLLVLVLPLLLRDPADSQEVLQFGLPGLLGLFGVVLLSFIFCISTLSSLFPLSVSMGTPRRTGLACFLLLHLVQGAMALAIVALYNGLWRLLVPDYGGVTDVLAMMPVWGLCLLVYLPPCAALLVQGVLSRFGSRAAVVLYLAFILCCSLPGSLKLGEHTTFTFFACMVWLGPLAALAMLGLGWYWLSRCSV